MPIEGKLGSLYVDKEQTQPLFPRTKTKAITDDDNIRLDITLDSLKTTVNSKASEAFVMNAIANAQLGGGEGDIDLSGFATKDDIAVLATKEELTLLSNTIPTTPKDIGAEVGGAADSALNSAKTYVNEQINAIDYPVDSVNGKTGTVSLNASDVGAAPSGYGLGTEYARGLNSTSDLNLITQNGWYTWHYNNIPKNTPTDNSLFLDCMFVMGSGASCIQLVFDTQNHANTGTILKRVNYGENYFSNWEYINPPMLAGISYRTTERYMGRPVFMIAVNLGNTPAAGATKDIPHGIPDIETVIDYWGTYANQQAIFNNDNIDTILVTPTVVRVKMSSAAGNGGYNLSMVFKYIKNGI